MFKELPKKLSIKKANKDLVKLLFNRRKSLKEDEEELHDNLLICISCCETHILDELLLKEEIDYSATEETLKNKLNPVGVFYQNTLNHFDKSWNKYAIILRTDNPRAAEILLPYASFIE